MGEGVMFGFINQALHLRQHVRCKAEPLTRDEEEVEHRSVVRRGGDHIWMLRNGLLFIVWAQNKWLQILHFN